MKRDKVKIILICILGLLLGLWLLTLHEEGKDSICDLYHNKTKGKIARLVTVKLVYFQLDNDSTYYYFPTTYFNVKYINCSPNEGYFVEQVGDSVIKEANSKFVKVKRGEKTFIIELPIKGCK